MKPKHLIYSYYILLFPFKCGCKSTNIFPINNSYYEYLTFINSHEHRNPHPRMQT